MSDPSEVQQRFDAAVTFLKRLPPAGAPDSPGSALSSEDKLCFYALYKQATQGRNTAPAPSFFDMVGKYKWEAWSRLGDMERSQAMQEYVEAMLKKAQHLPGSQELDDFVEQVTPRKTVVARAMAVATPTAVLFRDNEAELSAVAEREERLSRELESLRSNIEDDSRRVGRVEGLLARGEVSKEGPVSGELLEALQAVEAGLRASDEARDRLVQRIEAVERLGEQLNDSLKLAQAAHDQSKWIVLGLAAAVPLLVFGMSALADRYYQSRR